MKLVREILISPGFDKRDPDPRKNYGVHGCELRFYVSDARKTRTVQFVAFTDWLPPEVQEERKGSGVTQEVVGTQPMAADIGYHDNKPHYEGQERMGCHLNKRGWCYYDGSSVRADHFRDILLNKGSEGLWKALEDEYRAMFGAEDA